MEIDYWLEVTCDVNVNLVLAHDLSSYCVVKPYFHDGLSIILTLCHLYPDTTLFAPSNKYDNRQNRINRISFIATETVYTEYLIK